VSNLNNENLISFEKSVESKSDSKADYGKIIIDSLTSGSYNLKVSLVDTLKNVAVSNGKKFYIFNTPKTQMISTNQNDFLQSEYAAMTEKDVEAEFEKMTYIVNTQAEKRFESLNDLNDKRRFLYEFWKTKDVNPETRVLETKIAYMKRVNEANKFYKEAYTEGWKTDRGRIYIIYGKPDDVERYPFESQNKSYEIWKYDSMEGGGESVFIEIQHSTGVYRLVHCTFRNELKNPEWEDQLRTAF
jgi:GWxTD domain-containing protein